MAVKPMPRYVIHVGPHKTGSSYLQLLFQELSPQLRERGILYPAHWIDPRVPGHSMLVPRVRARDDAALSDELSKLNASDCETILISSEDIASLLADDIALLKSYLRGQPATIVFYCRRWLDLLPSIWQESVKQGQSTTLPQFMAGNLMNPFTSHALNYAIQLDRFEQVFGMENVTVASYSNIVEQDGGDLGDHFFRCFLSWPNAPLPRGLRPNASLDILDTETIRVLNAFEWMFCGRRSAELRVRYLNMKSALDLALPLAAMERHRAALRLNENAPGLRMLHEEIFKKYGPRLAPPKSGRYFFVQKQGSIHHIDQSYLLMDGVTVALRMAYQKVRGADQ